MPSPQSHDDLDAPLGLGRAARTDLPPAHRGLKRAFIAGTLAAAATLAVYLVNADPGAGGQPFAIAKIEQAKKPEPPVAALPADDVATTGSIATAKRGDDGDIQNGVRVTRLGQNTPGALVIQVPDTFGVRLTPAPDKRLVERAAAGLLPRIGADGARPSEVYARPLVTGGKLKANAPRIALVVTGLGLNPVASGEHIAKLPGAVTLAFAPYGPELEKQVARARADGHEVMLQAPMEPFDFAANNPGPHTLVAGAPPAETLADLQWHMARFSGYVGIVNFLGGKFTADAAAFTPVLREIGSRGLIYLDDASSPRSLAAKLAGEAGASVVQADMAVDADPSAAAVEASLIKLEGIARGRGFAIATASALPVSVDRVARFAKALEGRGIALVPLSALGARGSALAAGKPAQ